jgi:membrane associated rhomboid family serine protease
MPTKTSKNNVALPKLSPDIQQLLRATIYPLLFIAIIWSVFSLDKYLHLELYQFGVYPRTLKGLLGILTSALIHSNSSINHIFSNSVPLFVLGTALFYFYRPIAFKVFFSIWIISGFWLWVLSRPSYHIGASTIVYGLVFFLFFSGWIRKSKPLMGVSLLVVFLYGSIVWGIFPIDWSVSFEGHAYGALVGTVLAFVFKNQGPQRQIYDWENPNYEDVDFEILSDDSEQSPSNDK